MSEISNAARAAAMIATKTDLRPVVGMVLGSGLGSFADSVEDAVRFSFADLPGFPVSTVSSHKGELVIGAGADQYPSYTQTGGVQQLTQAVEAICEMFPMFGRMRMLRSWGGIVDLTPDRSPILGATPVPGLFANCGWGTGGFKATPASGALFAHHMATGAPHPIAAPFGLDRFAGGRLIDEAAAAAVAH